MKPQDISFTMKPAVGSCYVQMTFSCRTPGELMNAKEAIITSMDTIGNAWNREDKRVDTEPNRTKAMEKLLDTISYALLRIKETGTHGQYDYTEGLIKAAFIGGVISEEKFRNLSEHLESLKGHCDYQNDLKDVANPVSWEEVNA